MIDINEKSDVGKGNTLLFQKNAAGMVRAVVKNPAGDIVARGSVQPIDNALVSKREAMSEFITSMDDALQVERDENAKIGAFFGIDTGAGAVGRAMRAPAVEEEDDEEEDDEEDCYEDEDEEEDEEE